MLKKILLVIAAIIAILIAGVLALYLLPANQEAELNEKNSEIYSLMVAGGIEDAVVDVNADNVLVTYELPENLNKEASWFHTMGAVAAATPNAKTLVIETRDSQQVDRVTVNIADVTAFLSGRLSEAEFRSKMAVTMA